MAVVAGNKASSTFHPLNLPLWLLGAATGPAQPFLWPEPGGPYVCFPVVSHAFHCQVPALHGLPHHWLTALWGRVIPSLIPKLKEKEHCFCSQWFKLSSFSSFLWH